MLGTEEVAKFVFGEVITQRLAVGGAEGRYGAVPDLAVVVADMGGDRG